MAKILSLEEETFGLDISDSSIKIVKIKRKGKGFALVSYSMEKIPSGIVESGAIKDELALAKIIRSTVFNAKGKRINTKYVVASLPEEKSFSQVIQMPQMTEDELKIAVPLEAENYIPMTVDEVYLDFQVISPVKNYFNRYEILIAATPKKIVDSYVSCIKKAGFLPMAFETESEAVARALVKKDMTSSLLVLVDIGENNTNFIVFAGSSVRFTCSIPISAKLLTETISESLKVELPEAEKLKAKYGLSGDKGGEKVFKAINPIIDDLALQIKKYLNFYRDRSSFEYMLPEGKKEKILICGGGSELLGLPEFLSKKLEISVEKGDPLANFLIKKPKNIIKEDLMSFTTAIGLALRQTGREI